MLLGLDEYPFHQMADTFAAVAGSDPSWNDGHYVCAADREGRVAFTSNVRLYANNDVLDGFVCLRHAGKQYNLRVSRQLRPDMERLGAGPLDLHIVEPLQTIRLALDRNDLGIRLDVTCHTGPVPYMGPIEIRRIDGRLLSERATYEVTGSCSGWVEVGGERIELDPTASSFFRNHSWGFQPPRGRPVSYGSPTPGKRAPGVRHWTLFHCGEIGGFFFVDPSGRAAANRGALMEHERIVPLAAIEPDIEFHPGGRRLRNGKVRLTDIEGRVLDVAVHDLGWVYCQGGGYFGGFDDRLGQGIYRGVDHQEGEVWDVSHPTTIVDAAGRDFEFEHDWAESFVRFDTADTYGLAHYECVRVVAPS